MPAQVCLESRCAGPTRAAGGGLVARECRRDGRRSRPGPVEAPERTRRVAGSSTARPAGVRAAQWPPRTGRGSSTGGSACRSQLPSESSVGNPVQTDHRFRPKPLTESGPKRSLSPAETGHRFRSKPITVKRHSKLTRMTNWTYGSVLDVHRGCEGHASFMGFPAALAAVVLLTTATVGPRAYQRAASRASTPFSASPWPALSRRWASTPRSKLVAPTCSTVRP